MKNCFGETPLWECSRTLCDVAMGRKKADLIIRGAKLVNVCTREITDNTDIAVSEGRIALVGNADHIRSDNIIDATGLYAAPGFMDAHMHIESSMITVREYAKAVIPHGTTTIFPDAHEICNVLGTRGVKMMAEEARTTPLKCRMVAPSCVPAVPGFEDTGSEIGPEDIKEMMSWDEIAGLGEMMNFPGVIYSDEKTHAIIGETLRAKKTATGHYSVPETGPGLNAYAASGVSNCHESSGKDDALAKMRLGMYAMFREGSAWHDLHETSKSLHGLSESRFAIIVSDDSHPETLINCGHADHLVRRAIEEGIDPINAIQMVTINPAQCFHMDRETGSITPGKCADIVLFESLKDINVRKTIINGVVAAQDGKVTYSDIPYKYPECATKSVHLKDPVTEDTFRIACDGGSARVNVIEIVPARTPTVRTQAELEVRNGNIIADPGQDILKACVFERHRATGKKAFGFIKGFNIKRGAVASTVNHDAHNLMVMGTNDRDMAAAANALIECGGGHVAVEDGIIKAIVKLPIAGLMSDRPVSEMNDSIKALWDAWRELGCDRVSPFMTMSILSLACIPELRLTDRGLVDCTDFEFVPLIIR